jgi:DNA topoisomerase-2
MSKMTSKKRDVKQIDMREHIKKKSMWSGSKNTQKIETYVIDGDIATLKELKYPPTLLKIIDEIIVNAIDHHVIFDKVTEIKVSINELGMICVYNNGPGIEIKLVKSIRDITMFTPQLIFSEYLSGSNLDDDNDRVVGGQNGLGAKITSVHSTIFTVETYDDISKILYKQNFLNGLLVVEPPIMTLYKGAKLNDDEKKILITEKISKEVPPTPFTRITFIPDYKEFKINISTFYPTLLELIRMRVYQASAFTNLPMEFTYDKIIDSKTNDKTDSKTNIITENIHIKNFPSYCEMFVNDVFVTTLQHEKYPWDVCIGISDGKEKNVSLINGINVPNGGTNIKHIQNLIIEVVKPRIGKYTKKYGVRFNKNIITSNLFIFMRGSIPSLEFTGQSKDECVTPIENFSNHIISIKDIDKLWKFLEKYLESILDKKNNGTESVRSNRNRVIVSKYDEAKYCKDKDKALECCLIIAEGDSAITTVKKGLLSEIKTSPNFNYNYFGTFIIKGVAINGLKESVIGKDGKIKPNVKTKNNERIDSLKTVLNLNYGCTYDTSEQGEKEFKTLRYGFVAGLLDQDLDGFNIFGLIATYFLTYWPALVKRGFVRRINTPLIRAYPKNKTNTVKVFYNNNEYRKWISEFGEDNFKKLYKKPRYYKGLGQHSETTGKEITNMFKNIDDKIKIYILDEQAITNMYLYYGKNTNDRKKALSSVVDESLADQMIDIKIPLSVHFHHDTKLYQRDNLIRKLINVMDGFVISRRKVFYTIRDKTREPVLVSSLSGAVRDYANYHHGNASVEGTIMHMAQSMPYARNLPLLIPYTEMGSRSGAFQDLLGARYAEVGINYRLTDKLFRREDDYILDYELDDGKRFEPKYYAPIIPYSLCETNEIPATGWRMVVHARHIKDIFKNIRNMIEGKIEHCEPLSPWNKDFKGDIQDYPIKDKAGNIKHIDKYYVGKYIYDEKTRLIHITELPVGMFSSRFLKGDDKDPSGVITRTHTHVEYDDPDESTDEQINIKLYLRKGAINEILRDYGNEYFDPIIDYFDLKWKIEHFINLINEKGEIVEYKKYEDVFDDWYKLRKELYAKRIDRELVINDLELLMLKNVQLFHKSHISYNITPKTKLHEVNKLLSANSYDTIDIRLLNNPDFTDVNNIKMLITDSKVNEKSNYDYLLDLSYKHLTEEAFITREKRIEYLKNRNIELQTKGKFKGANIWLKELDELEMVIDEGIKSTWMFGTNDYSYDNDDDNDEKEQNTKTKAKVKAKVKAKSKAKVKV